MFGELKQKNIIVLLVDLYEYMELNTDNVNYFNLQHELELFKGDHTLLSHKMVDQIIYKKMDNLAAMPPENRIHTMSSNHPK